jgi:hypothetical protein
MLGGVNVENTKQDNGIRVAYYIIFIALCLSVGFLGLANL